MLISLLVSSIQDIGEAFVQYLNDRPDCPFSPLALSLAITSTGPKASGDMRWVLQILGSCRFQRTVNSWSVSQLRLLVGWGQILSYLSCEMQLSRLPHKMGTQWETGSFCYSTAMHDLRLCPSPGTVPTGCKGKQEAIGSCSPFCLWVPFWIKRQMSCAM